MNNVEKSKNNFDMKEIHKLINRLIKEDRLKFKFYNVDITRSFLF